MYIPATYLWINLLHIFMNEPALYLYEYSYTYTYVCNCSVSLLIYLFRFIMNISADLRCGTLHLQV